MMSKERCLYSKCALPRRCGGPWTKSGTMASSQTLSCPRCNTLSDMTTVTLSCSSCGRLTKRHAISCCSPLRTAPKPALFSQRYSCLQVQILNAPTAWPLEAAKFAQRRRATNDPIPPLHTPVPSSKRAREQANQQQGSLTSSAADSQMNSYECKRRQNVRRNREVRTTPLPG